MTDTPTWHAQEIHDAHALAIGRLVISWNEFQESLAQLFAMAFGVERWPEALAAWQSLTNDSAQRDMLAAVAKQRFGEKSQTYKKIRWVVEQAKATLANNRNFGIHTPLMVFTDAAGKTGIYPNSIFGNVRASADRLQDQDLVALFAAYEKQIRSMSTFVLQITYHLSNPETHSLPEKPDLQLPQSAATPKG